MKFKRSKNEIEDGFGGARQGKDSSPKPNDIWDVHKHPDGQDDTVRYVGPMMSVGVHWIAIKTKEGKFEKNKFGGYVAFPRRCLAWDSKSQTKDSTKPCPYCLNLPRETEKDKKLYRFTVEYWRNAIIRSIEENAPGKIKVTEEEKESGFKKKGSKSWTPIRMCLIKPSVVETLQRKQDRNTHKYKDKKTGKTITKAFDFGHEKFGKDIIINYDSSRDGAKKYEIDVADHTPLTEDQQNYLAWDIDLLPEAETLKAAEENIAQLSKSHGFDLKTGGKKKKKDEDEDDDVDLEDQDDDDSDDTPKGKKKNKKQPAKGKSKDEDDDDDSDDEDDESEDDDDSDDEDDDEPPKKGGKASKGGKNKKRSSDEDDEDDDQDEEDEDDDEPASKKKKGGKVNKKKSKDEDDDEDEDDEDSDSDEDDEDDDDLPPKKKGSKDKQQAKGKKKKPLDDDDEDQDDEDSDDSDDQDDEDDHPRKKKGKKDQKKKPAKGGKSKKRSVLDDDEDDEEDEDDSDDDEDDDD